MQDAPNDYNGTFTLVSDKVEGESAIKLSAGEDSGGKEKGVYLGQHISNAYAGYKFKYSISMKKVTDSSVGNLEIDYKNGSNRLIKRVNIAINSTEFVLYTGDIEMPKDAKSLDIFLTCEDGEVIFDNAVLNRVIE